VKFRQKYKFCLSRCKQKLYIVIFLEHVFFQTSWYYSGNYEIENTALDKTAANSFDFKGCCAKNQTVYCGFASCDQLVHQMLWSERLSNFLLHEASVHLNGRTQLIIFLLPKTQFCISSVAQCKIAEALQIGSWSVRLD